MQATNQVPSMIDEKVQLYTALLEGTDNPFPIASTDAYQKSFRKALKMYKDKTLDGTKTTFICKGRVITPKDVENLPDGTIIDEPEMEQYTHCRTLYGPGRPDGFHYVNTSHALA